MIFEQIKQMFNSISIKNIRDGDYPFFSSVKRTDTPRRMFHWIELNSKKMKI